MKTLKKTVVNSVCCSVSDFVLNHLGNYVEDFVEPPIRSCVGVHVYNSVQDSVWNSVDNSVWNYVDDTVKKAKELSE